LPKGIIYNIESNIENEEILDYLARQNILINRYSEGKEIVNELKFKYSIKSKNENLKHSIFEVIPELRKILIEPKVLNINFMRCNVKDFVSIIRCFNCYGFGHIKSQCKNEKICSICSDDTHSYKDCKSNHKNCTKCQKFNERLKTKDNRVDTNHNTLYKLCPSLEHIKNTIKSKIDYGL
jgi:hypothetical protein